MPCLLPDVIKQTRKTINEAGGFSALRTMTAQQRIELFAKDMDLPGQTSTAEWFNRQIENRIFKPGQIQATKDWLKKLEKKKIKISNKEGIIDRITNKKDVFNPKHEGFAGGLAKQALGFEITQEDAKTLFDKATTANEARKALLTIVPNYTELTTEELAKLDDAAVKARAEYGKTLVDFQHTYEDINLKAQTLAYAQKNFVGKAFDKILKIAGNIKSVKASFDISYLRQIQSAAYVNKDAAWEAWKTGGRAWLATKEEADTILGEILTRPNAITGRYNQFGIEVGIKEEAFPESWISQILDKYGLEKINAFRRSETAFNIALQSARANLFDWMWEQSNGDIKLLKEQNVGEAINTVTGRGNVAVLTPNDPRSQRIINNLLFAPKWLASRVRAFTDLQYIGELGKITPQGIRAKAAVGNVIMTAVSIALAALIWGLDDDDKRKPGSLFDPRSSDFGKVVIGRTRFDLTAGTATLITLTSRLGTLQSRTLKGTLRPVEWQDVLGRFLEGKSSPGLQAANNIRQEIMYLTGLSEKAATDFMGKEYKKEDWLRIVGQYLAPISVEAVAETGAIIVNEGLGKESWVAVTGVVADIIGIGANTYDKK